MIYQIIGNLIEINIATIYFCVLSSFPVAMKIVKPFLIIIFITIITRCVTLGPCNFFVYNATKLN